MNTGTVRQLFLRETARLPQFAHPSPERPAIRPRSEGWTDLDRATRDYEYYPNMLGILELLAPRGLDLTSKVKIVRHQDQRHDLTKMERDGVLELYQSYQAKPVFECDYIVSFIGLENSRARFFGVYRVAGPAVSAREHPLPPDFEYPDFAPRPENYFYALEAVPGFDDLKNRVVIDWGMSALAWHQWLAKPGVSPKDKEVVEILPSGYVRDFPGYLDFTISFDELAAIIENPLANRQWHRMLSAVAGVYLIVDGRTGKQYVGSACGEGGLLGRWTQYAATGHGGNVQLRELVAGDTSYRHDFTFTVLRTLPRTLTQKEVVGFESLYKKKLGSRAFGLNS